MLGPPRGLRNGDGPDREHEPFAAIALAWRGKRDHERATRRGQGETGRVELEAIEGAAVKTMKDKSQLADLIDQAARDRIRSDFDTTLVVEAAAGFSLSHTGAPLYGYSSMSLGFRAQTPLQIFEAETYPTSRVSPAVADGAASGGKAVQDPQGQPITPPSITSAEMPKITCIRA